MSTLFWKPHLLFGHQKLGDTKQTSTKKWKDKRCWSEQDKNCPLFLSTPFSWTIPQSLSQTLSKASVFSSTAQCPGRTSSVKPPDRTTTSSVELVLSGSIFPPRLQWNWSPHSFCHALTAAILSFLAGLLPLSKAFIVYKAVLLVSYWKKRKTDHITLLFQFLHWLPIQ